MCLATRNSMEGSTSSKHSIQGGASSPTSVIADAATMFYCPEEGFSKLKLPEESVSGNNLVMTVWDIESDTENEDKGLNGYKRRNRMSLRLRNSVIYNNESPIPTKLTRTSESPHEQKQTIPAPPFAIQESSPLTMEHGETRSPLWMDTDDDLFTNLPPTHSIAPRRPAPLLHPSTSAPSRLEPSAHTILLGGESRCPDDGIPAEVSIPTPPRKAGHRRKGHRRTNSHFDFSFTM